MGQEVPGNFCSRLSGNTDDKNANGTSHTVGGRVGRPGTLVNKKINDKSASHAQPPSAVVPTSELPEQSAPVPPQQTWNELKPMKVDCCDSFGLTSITSPPLDPELPVKKQSIFAHECGLRDFITTCPLKTRAPEY